MQLNLTDLTRLGLLATLEVSDNFRARSLKALKRSHGSLVAGPRQRLGYLTPAHSIADPQSGDQPLCLYSRALRPPRSGHIEDTIHRNLHRL